MENLQLKIALAQYPCGSDIGEIAGEAQAAGAEIVVFPEMYSNGYAPFDPNDPAARIRWCAQAESLDGEFVGRFHQAAKAHQVYVVATFLEKAEPKPFNAALLIGPSGRPLLHHRKVHICDFDGPELACARGSGFAACDIETGAGPVRVGLMICMDREYPESARSLSRQGAEIVLVPNCCDLASDCAVGDVRIAQARGRAFETVIGIAVANYPAPRCDGHSFAVDATGRIIAMAAADQQLSLAAFDLAAIRKSAARNGFAGRFDELRAIGRCQFTLTQLTACRALCEAGLSYPLDALDIAVREERWAVSLPDGHIAWFPASEAGARRLDVERRILGLLTERCSFRVPEVLFVSNAGFDVRRMVPGQCDPWGLYRRCQRDSGLAQKIGRSVGEILVEQHARIVEADLAGWLPRWLPWPEPGAWIRERLPRVIDDRGLIRRLGEVIDMYEGTRVETGDCALVHGDLGLHNLALDPQTDAGNGVFDYESAAWTDRHHDFRYLLFDIGREDMLDAALEVCEPTIGQSLDRDRIRLYNAACAITFLAFRVGVPPGQKSCGRTLVEDLQWARTALARLPN